MCHPQLRALACLALALALAAASASGAPQRSGKPGKPLALYSWSCGTEWCYALLPKVDPPRSEDEVFAHPGKLIGVEAALAAIAAVPAGTAVEWIVPFVETRLAYPPDLNRVRRACMDRALLFYGPEGPLAEAAGFPSPARKVKYGERLYFLDHKVVALPDFTIRYLGSGALGDQPPHAHYQEFEVEHGGSKQTVRTDPNFGAWTPPTSSSAGGGTCSRWTSPTCCARGPGTATCGRGPATSTSAACRSSTAGRSPRRGL